MRFGKPEFSSAFVDFIKDNLVAAKKLKKKSTERVHKYREKQRLKRQQEGQLKSRGGSRQGAGRPKITKKTWVEEGEYKACDSCNSSQGTIIEDGATQLTGIPGLRNKTERKVTRLSHTNSSGTVVVKEEVTQDDDLAGVNKTQISIRRKKTTKSSANGDRRRRLSSISKPVLPTNRPIQSSVNKPTQTSTNLSIHTSGNIPSILSPNPLAQTPINQWPIIQNVQLPIIQNIQLPINSHQNQPFILPTNNFQTPINPPVNLLFNGSYQPTINGPLTLLINTDNQSSTNKDVPPQTNKDNSSSMEDSRVKPTIDEHSAYGEYIASVFRDCRRNESEIKIARELIGNILLDLKTGSFGKAAAVQLQQTSVYSVKGRETPTIRDD